MKVSVKSLSRVWLFATLWTVCSPPGSSVHGIFQAGRLESVAIPFIGYLPNPGIVSGSLHYRQHLYCLSHQDWHTQLGKGWNIARISNTWHRDTWWTNAFGEIAGIDSLDVGLPQTSPLNKTQQNQVWWSEVRVCGRLGQKGEAR